MTPLGKGKDVYQQLAKEIKVDTYHEWTPGEIALYKRKGFIMNSRYDKFDLAYDEVARTLAAAAAFEKDPDAPISSVKTDKGKEKEGSTGYNEEEKKEESFKEDEKEQKAERPPNNQKSLPLRNNRSPFED